jgi:protein-L-isoaspartate(D-aspartate) O-methyltransferase
LLEIGVGSGYAAAILARLAREVVSLERYATLAIEAARRLEALGVGNVRVLQGDGMAPDRDLGGFDRIMLHGAILQVPEALTDRLAPGGALLFARMEPGGAKKGAQRLIRLERNAAGAFLTRDMGPCRLVPLHAEVAQAL